MQIAELGIGIKNASNNQDIPVFPQLTSFALTESIYSIVPIARFTMQDAYGHLSEYGFFTRGVDLKLEYKIAKTKISPKYTVFSYATDKETELRGFHPNINLGLKSQWFNNQDLLSTAYKNRLSSVYQQILTPFGFLFDINDTGNNTYWYRNNETPIQFIERT